MIRRWSPADAEASYGVFHDAVHEGAETHYSAAERQAWVPRSTMPESWPARFDAQKAWVAKDAAGLTGLISLGADGYLDLFFVIPRARGNGTAVQLYDRLVSEAQADRHRRLTTHASLLLHPFLVKRGWTTLHAETVERAGEKLRRFAMTLGPDQLASQVS